MTKTKKKSVPVSSRTKKEINSTSSTGPGSCTTKDELCAIDLLHWGTHGLTLYQSLEEDYRVLQQRYTDASTEMSDLRRAMASLENRYITRDSAIQEIVLEEQQQAKKISDLNQENATLVAHNQILKSSLSASSSIIRDVLDIS